MIVPWEPSISRLALLAYGSQNPFAPVQFRSYIFEFSTYIFATACLENYLLNTTTCVAKVHRYEEAMVGSATKQSKIAESSASKHCKCIECFLNMSSTIFY